MKKTKKYQVKFNKAQELIDGGMDAKSAIKQVGISAPTYYRYKNNPILVTKLAKRAPTRQVTTTKIAVAFMNRNELLELFR